MKRIVVACLLAAWHCAGAAPALARTCSPDVVPAATLLLPYFEVDLANPGGRTTLMSVSNATDRGVLAHFVVWTDLGVPTLAFDVYLTGFDVQTINLRDLFAGQLPRTASDGQDPSDTLSPQGEVSRDINFPNCAGLLPPAAPAPAFVDHLRRAHQGFSSPVLEGKCAGVPFLDNVARGYVTVDVVNRCTTLTPADAGYFGPEGVAEHDNVLWGDFYLVDPAGNFAQGENLVRIESDPARFAGKPSFYGRYVNGSGLDGREPLPTVWAPRFLSGELFTGTDLIYWRSSETRTEPFLCHQRPAWYPIQWEIDRQRIVLFDEQENPDIPIQFPGVPPPPPPSPFPAESGRVSVSGPALPSPFDFGWIFVDMKTIATGARPALSQSWLGVIADAQGRFSVGFEAEPLDNGCSPLTTNPTQN